MTSRPLEGALVQHLAQNLITHYGYLAVFVLMLAESACIPVPSEVIMMFGGAMAAGAFTSTSAPPSLIGVVAAGVLGNVAGSYLAWAVGKYAGRAAIGRWGRRIGIREHEIDRAVAWFERHGPVAVLVGRVIPVIRTFISLPAGFAGMPASQFGLYTTLGCIPWTAALGIAGYALGANWDSVAKDFNGPTYAIAGILLVAVIVILVRRRRARNASQAGSPVNAEAAGPNGSALPAGMAAPGGHAGAPIPAPGWAGGRPDQSADWPDRAAGRPGQPGERPGWSAAGSAGQQPPSYVSGAQDARGQHDAYRPQDPRSPQDAYRPQDARGPRDEWSDGPQDPWGQPSDRPGR
jgi:membrane protein DedA with SNARE-associated domain